MTRKDFELIATTLRLEMQRPDTDKVVVSRIAEQFAKTLANTNERFDAARFLTVATGRPDTFIERLTS